MIGANSTDSNGNKLDDPAAMARKRPQWRHRVPTGRNSKSRRHLAPPAPLGDRQAASAGTRGRWRYANRAPQPPPPAR